MLQLSAHQISCLESLAAETGFPAQLFLDEAISDWVAVSADTYIKRAEKRQKVLCQNDNISKMPLKLAACGGVR